MDLRGCGVKMGVKGMERKSERALVNLCEREMEMRE